mmetsp:Transcript_281/g.763  ORF Transcript_281/g.763 Transcript_281/m.763 type:complete len:181 (+) Transcript_281:590-1132(+)
MEYGDWSFVVLDHLWISVMKIPDERDLGQQDRALMAEAILEKIPLETHPFAQRWNGAIGEEQQAWFKAQLDDSHRRGRRVGVFSHIPILESAASDRHLAWDHKAVLKLLDEYNHVEFYMAGHCHRGGYALRNGVHHITIEGMLESSAAVEASYSVVNLSPETIRIEGVGGCSSYSFSVCT